MISCILHVSVLSIQYASKTHVTINLQGCVAMVLPFWTPWSLTNPPTALLAENPNQKLNPEKNCPDHVLQQF